MAKAVFVVADGSKPYNPVVIWWSQLSHCFRKLTVPTRPAGLHYFANAKSWMDTEIMEHILGRLDRQLKLGNRHVIIFLDDVPSHPETLKTHWNSSRQKTHLPKNTTSKLQPAHAGIFLSLKDKYRKRLVRHVVSLLNGKNTASTIIRQITVLAGISWLRAPWDEVNESTIRNCFKKCGFSQVDRGDWRSSRRCRLSIFIYCTVEYLSLLKHEEAINTT